MGRKKLVAAASAIVAAMLVIAVTFAIFSREQTAPAADSGQKTGADPGAAAVHGAELVEIRWKTDQDRADAKEPKPQRADVPPRPEGTRPGAKEDDKTD